MLKNYFKVAFRNLLKYKFYSAINIFGMTIAMAACMLIIIYVTDELSYDRFHAKADRMYTVGLHGKIAGQEIRTSTTCPPLYEALVQEVPGVEAATRIVPYYDKAVVRYGDKVFTEKKVYYADSNFFNFFSFKLLKGDPATVLREPNTIVLTERAAQKYFGAEDPIGKLLTIGNDNKSFKVTGLAADAPSNSHVKFEMLLSSNSRDDLRGHIWLNNYLHTYFILDKNTSLSAVESKFNGLVIKYVGPEVQKFLGTTMEQMEAQGGQYGYYATLLTDTHLRSTSQHEIEPTGNIRNVYFFGAVGLFIILIACINFMNLSTARSAGRAKEVGLRKTLGSYRSQMINQFLAESVVYAFIAVIFALLVCQLAMPYFNLLAGKQLSMAVLQNPAYVIGLIALVLIVGLLAGSYPAFYLTSFNAVEVLKGKVRGGMKSKGVRSTLVVSQFALSIFLIIFTAVVYQQIRFMQDRDMGIDKHGVIIVNNTDRLGKNVQAFKNEIDQQAAVEKSSYTTNTFPGINNTTVFKAAGSEQDHIMGIYYADYDQKDLLKFELIEGRYFSKDFPSDSSAIIINEAAAREFNYEHPLQEQILFNGNNHPEKLTVIGVFKDFNFESLKTKVRPLAIRLSDRANQLMIRYKGDPRTALQSVEKVWKKTVSNEPFDYSFLDDDFDELFRSEQRMGTVFGVFAALAILIACLGLFALAAFTAEQRTKEIGIRKVMGASVTNLTLLLSKEFTFLVLIAFVPAAVCGWFVAEQWLLDFEYRIQIDPMIIVWSGVGAIVIAWLTVSYQSIKAAVSNPVTSLRYE